MVGHGAVNQHRVLLAKLGENPHLGGEVLRLVTPGKGSPVQGVGKALHARLIAIVDTGDARGGEL